MSVDISQEDGIWTLTINRPEALNSLNLEVLEQLEKAVDRVATETSISVVIVTGGGEKAFVAGADIVAMKDMTPQEAHAFARKGQGVFRKLEQLPQATIAAVNGFALGGGCELALACDMRVASTKAKFGQPEVGLGIIPGFGGTQRLPRVVGRAKALELILSGRVIDAAEAVAVGLVNKAVPVDELQQEVLGIARSIADKGPMAVRRAKRAASAADDVSLDAGTEIEASLFGLCFGLEQQEGMSAFLEKRRARFDRETVV